MQLEIHIKILRAHKVSMYVSTSQVWDCRKRASKEWDSNYRNRNFESLSQLQLCN